jgi:alanine dehydrogenase
MKIGVPREIKNNEFRVGLTPASVYELVKLGHQVCIESMAGAGIGMSDEVYIESGASIAGNPEEIFRTCDMIVKVKEPQPDECRSLRDGQILFTYLHLAPDPEQTRLLLESGVTAIAYETVTDAENRLPLLTPMSEIAGKLSVQAGARCLEKPQGGGGVLLGGVPGVEPGKVLVIGGGIVGSNAAVVANGMGADVMILDASIERLRKLNDRYGNAIKCVYSTRETIKTCARDADLVIGAVLVPGAVSPKLLTRDDIKSMKQGAVTVDVAIDQGGCFETSRPTTHQDPTYTIDGVLHYCVANMPGAVPKTSTFALNNVTLPYVISLAGKGYKQAILDDQGLANGLNVHRGRVTHPAVAKSLNYEYIPARDAIKQESCSGRSSVTGIRSVRL